MTDKEFRRMSRADLIQIIFQYQQKEMELQKNLDESNQQLDDRRIRIENAGSIAEAALSINHVMEVAQAAADQYLAEIRSMTALPPDAKTEETITAAKEQADKIIREAKEQSNDILNQTVEACKKYKTQTDDYCAKLKKRTEEECGKMIVASREAKKTVEPKKISDEKAVAEVKQNLEPKQEKQETKTATKPESDIIGKPIAKKTEIKTEGTDEKVTIVTYYDGNDPSKKKTYSNYEKILMLMRETSK